MNATYRAPLSALAILAALLSAPGAQAVVINASDYRVGADLTDIFPGVTLEDATHSFGQGATFDTSPLVVGATTTDQGPPLTYNTLGSETGGNVDVYNLLANDSQWSELYVALSHPITSVTVTGFDDDGDNIYIWPFDTNGNLLTPVPQSSGYCLNPGSYGCQRVELITTYSSTTPISSFIVGSWSQAAYITKIEIPGLMPEPPSLALFGCGLLALGIRILRRRGRHS